MSHRPKRAPSLNIRRQGAELVAETIKFRLMSGTNTWDVYVRPDGSVVMERPDNPTTPLPMPEEWLVGRYKRRALTADIQSDLEVRLMEIVPKRRKAA
jgi:hypothetical protein